MEGGFLTACFVRGRGGGEVKVSHLMFADDTLILCKLTSSIYHI